MTAGQRRAFDALYARYRLAADAPLDPAAEFGRDAGLTLEIGFGNGDLLFALARDNPREDFVGVEVWRPGVAQLLARAGRESLANLRVVCGDARAFVETCLPRARLDRALILFPDPWPKRRHNKRRLLTPDFLRALARALKPGGALHVATDWRDYAASIDAALRATPAFEADGVGDELLAALSPSLQSQPTRFERRARAAGREVFRWCLRRARA